MPAKAGVATPIPFAAGAALRGTGPFSTSGIFQPTESSVTHPPGIPGGREPRGNSKRSSSRSGPGVDPEVRGRVEMAYNRWKLQQAENAISWEFIEQERNNILEEYRFNLHPLDHIDVVVTMTA
jgi:hypothetical protein